MTQLHLSNENLCLITMKEEELLDKVAGVISNEQVVAGSTRQWIRPTLGAKHNWDACEVRKCSRR